MDFILNNQRINLERAVFNRVAPIQTSNGFKVIVSDEVKDLRVGNGDVEFKYVRNVRLDPNALFVVSVEFLYKATFDESLPRDKVEKTITKEIELVINRTTMPSVASQIVANLTAINGGAPLVVNPSFVRATKGENI